MAKSSHPLFVYPYEHQEHQRTTNKKAHAPRRYAQPRADHHRNIADRLLRFLSQETRSGISEIDIYHCFEKSKIEKGELLKIDP